MSFTMGTCRPPFVLQLPAAGRTSRGYRSVPNAGFCTLIGMIVRATIDRVVHHSVILECDVPSYLTQRGIMAHCLK